MVDSMYRQSFGVAGEAPDEHASVQDDELLIGEAGGGGADGRRFSSVTRSSRRAAAVHEAGVRPGDTLAHKYVVEQVIGRSGPEMVVIARHLELDQRVRVRYLSPEASTSPEAVARFQRGARKAREMRSEHAERIVDFGKLETGSPYRVSELPNGPSLEEIIRVRGALPIDEAVDIVVQACEAVGEAHGSSVIHRSLCTSNVFVERRADGSLVVKILDFGVAATLDLSPSGDSVFGGGPGANEGALGFASPEQIRNPGAVDARADVWALGAILYELLTGVRVFEAETPLTLLAMIAADQPAPIQWIRPELPEALEAIVLSCLEKDPEARPRSVVELASALAAFGSGAAPAVASRVARMAMRTSKPPPLPSTGPHSRRFVAPTRAIVRSTLAAPDPAPTALPPWAILLGAALVGVCVALAAALALRPQFAPTQAAALPPAVAPAPAPVALAPTASAAEAAPAGAKAPSTTKARAEVPAATEEPPPRPRPALQRPAKRAQPPEEERAASAKSPAPTTRVSAASRPDAESAGSRNALFGGIE
jgi:serine/threonine-protein kinase